jgi:hypothetical protein
VPLDPGGSVRRHGIGLLDEDVEAVLQASSPCVYRRDGGSVLFQEEIAPGLFT